MVVFDIRTDDSHARFIPSLNQRLYGDPAGIGYVSEFGEVCSPRWWACFDRGELPVAILSGKISYVGPRLDIFGEEEDLIEFVFENLTIGYDRVGFWANLPIRVGDDLTIIRTVIELPHWTGSMTYDIDLRAEWISLVAQP